MRRKGESRKCEGGSKSHSRGGKKGGDGLNRRRSAVSNDRKSGRGERRERRCRGGSWNLHTLIKLLFGSLALHVSAPSAAPVRPHPHSLCISGITSNSVFSFRGGGGVKKTETKKRSDCGYNLHLTAAPPPIFCPPSQLCFCLTSPLFFMLSGPLFLSLCTIFLYTHLCCVIAHSFIHRFYFPSLGCTSSPSHCSL